MSKLLLYLSLLLNVSFLHAQIVGDDREEFHFGVKAGVNLSNVYSATGTDFIAKNRTGFAGGGFITIPIGKYLGIQPEVLFSQKGANAMGTLNGEAYQFKRTTNSLDIPVLLQVKPLPHIALVVGPQLSFLMKQSDTYESDDSRIIIEQEFKDQSLRKANVGAVAGVDVWVLKILLSGRVGCDLLQNTIKTSSGNAPTYKSFWGQLTLGLRF